MQDEVYVGKGWENTYGINVEINVEKLLQLPKDQYGNVKLYLGKRKQQDEKSKATHFVKERKPLEKTPF
ncbi:hypothetical protein UFOVP697_2 [uncultured Caudovirales phage]|uniref:Uncharacterized protein n=1 Tax=uncultured Caudovirales phage TaxID=2100421 RepID=A0A6J5NMS5_9CAUD|nr:hypothetical protein UFOVP427_34 [uncultured Caudovirales phage]CAB4158288.1 hypothetical protein UFOVP697_2 [uncultured Caudovirales phage]